MSLDVDLTSSGTGISNAMNMSMDAQKRRYGDKLYDKNPQTGKYRCFFCNRDLRANFSRHISRHEVDGDQINEELKHAIINGLPLPPPSTMLHESTPNISTPSTPSVKLQSSTNKPMNASTNNISTIRSQQEQQFNQLILFVIRNASPSLLLSSITQNFIALAKEQIISPNSINLSSFYNSVHSIGNQIVINRGSIPEEAKQMEEILHLFHMGHKEELRKQQLQQEQYGSKCSICNEDGTSKIPLISCSGECIRSFHISCAIKSDGVSVYQISTLSAGYSAICDDCKDGKKVLRWASYKKQYFYLEFDDKNPPSEEQPAQIIHDDNLENCKVELGVGTELTLRLPPAIKKSKERNLQKNKQSITNDRENPNSTRWYDPYWCVWRDSQN